MVSLKIPVWDLKNHQIWEFGQLWRLPEREQCKRGSLSLRYILFEISFLTTFRPFKTLYDQISNICIRFVKSFNFQNLENFGDSWGENDASWKVEHGNQCCLKWHLWQLSSRSKHCMVKYKIFISDLSNLWNFRIWKILATPEGRTMHPGRLIMEFNVV